MKPPITTAQAMQHPDVVMTINTLGQMADELRTRLAEVEKDALAYQDLIYCVGMKHPNETRHETAKRYLRRTEQSTTEPAKEQA